MNKITKELLKTWNPCADGYRRFIELFSEGATLQEAIDGLLTDGHDDWAWWLFSACQRAGVCPETTSRGYRNSGNGNSGNWNSGDWNSGDGNSGNWNSGDRNSGDGNSGNGNSGNRNSGNGNSGNWNSGYGNSGNGNSGNGNSGYGNSGYGNSGKGNSGNRNSGYGNSGNWNSGDRNSGNFNRDMPPTIRVFEKECPRWQWIEAYKPMFLEFAIAEWVDSDAMTEAEKAQFQESASTGGFLRTLSYKEAFKRSWDRADKADRMRVKELPNFDAQIFYDISGIDLREGHDE